MTYALWIVQALLAVLFLMVAQMKLTQPLDVLADAMGLPGLLIRGIGLAEILGAIGLIVPGVVRIKPGLVPLAAAGLATLTLLAVGYHLLRGEATTALFPLVVAVLAAFVAYGRWQLAPLAGRSRVEARERELARTR